MSPRSSRGSYLLYQIAVVLLILWGIGFLGFHVGDVIHILLGLAVVLVLIRIVRKI
jgi:asparagine N-glycosylation enzyme membrane subunit Stt3